MLNATYEPINVCTVRRAAVLLLKERAELIEDRDGAYLHSGAAEMPRPEVIRLTRYAPVPRETRTRRITRRAIFARDGWRCQYCDSRSDLTVDHVIPRAKGGGSTWDNVVACCAPCNRRKGDMLPHVAGMVPRNAPRAPHPDVFIHVAAPRTPAIWEPWLRIVAKRGDRAAAQALADAPAQALPAAA
ncbi:MAG: HNH endonuclease [Solirubrobacteraceae bacterium]|nr:HNH endonuclease [Solirubrobacteraceae bacterium]